MGKIEITIIAISSLLLSLLATNPSSEHHFQTVWKQVESKMDKRSFDVSESAQIVHSVGLSLAKNIIEKSVIRDNFYFFSITMSNSGSEPKQLGIGFLGKVWLADFDINSVLNSDISFFNEWVQNSTGLNLKFQEDKIKFPLSLYRDALSRFNAKDFNPLDVSGPISNDVVFSCSFFSDYIKISFNYQFIDHTYFISSTYFIKSIHQGSGGESNFLNLLTSKTYWNEFEVTSLNGNKAEVLASGRDNEGMYMASAGVLNLSDNSVSFNRAQ